MLKRDLNAKNSQHIAEEFVNLNAMPNFQGRLVSSSKSCSRQEKLLTALHL